MLWFALALAGAISQAAYGFSVKVLQRRIRPFPLAGFSFLAASVMLFGISLSRGIPSLGPWLPVAIAVTVAINIIATALFYRAVSTTDLSLCIPMLAFTPVFLILTSFLILGEIPTPAGAAGIFLVAAGAWLLALEYENGRPVSLSGPFRILHADRGVQAMLLVAFLYSISVNYDKLVVENSDPVFGSAIVFLLLALAFICLSVLFHHGWGSSSPGTDSSPPEHLNPSDTSRKRAPTGPDIGPETSSPGTLYPETSSLGTTSPGTSSPGTLSPGTFSPWIFSTGQERTALRPRQPSRNIPILLAFPLVGLLLTLEVVSINTAYTLAIVPYVITVKRLSIFFSVLAGGLLLGERQLRGRIAGAVVMIGGAVLIGLAG